MRPPRAGIHLTVVVWLLLAACPLVVGEWRLSQLAQITSYGIFAMSLAFLWGQTGLLCFGQAIFFGVGAYVMALITKGMVTGVGDSTVIGLLAATLLAALVALAAGLLVFRGRGLSGAYFAIVTLAAALIAVPLSTEVLIWTALGGREVLLAAFLGALVVRSVESLLSEALGYYWLLGLGVLFIASVVIFPRGLLGRLLSLPPPRRMAGPAEPPR